MEIREATANDASDLAEAARASLSASYAHFVDEETIDDVIEQQYAPDRIADLLDDGDVVVCVATVDGDVVGFVQGAVVETDPFVGEIDWLHVHPDERREGVGVQLLGRVQERFRDRGASVLRGLVLEPNEDGMAFYAEHGFDRAGTSTVDVGDQSFTEVVFEKALGDDPTERVVERVTGPEDQTLFVEFSEAERGHRAPFYPVFGTRELTDRYGWYCGECESLDNAMDSMGRIVCNDCGNKRKATRWDASYL